MRPYEVLFYRHTTHNSTNCTGQLDWTGIRLLRVCWDLESFPQKFSLIVCVSDSMLSECTKHPHEHLPDCHSSGRKCCGRVTARSIRGSQKDPRLLKSHILIWAVVDNGVCSVFSHLALNWFLALFVFAFFLTYAQHLPNHCTVLFFLLTHSSSQPQYKYNVICLMYSVILLSWKSILFCSHTIYCNQ